MTASPGTTAHAGVSPSSGCDLSGRWLFAKHKVTDGLGNLQYVHNYLYYEIEQQGDSFEVTKSLFCFADAVGEGTFAVVADYSAALPSLQAHVSHDGRTGTSVASGGSCQIAFAKIYSVQGASLPYYLDPSKPLPNAEDEATDGMPGWEDWDGDNNPGVTGVLSGSVAGKIFTASREWDAMTGMVPDVRSRFRLPLSWDQEPNVMAFEGSPFLSATAVRAADASLHFAQFARLEPSQLTGDDTSICRSVRELAPTLTPEAAGL